MSRRRRFDIFPYVKQTRLELGQWPFFMQVTKAIFSTLQENIVKVPANSTDRLQPMDLSVNKSIEELRRSFGSGMPVKWRNNLNKEFTN